METETASRLRALVDHALATTPYYASRLASEHLAGHEGVDLLVRLPLLTRADLQAHGGQLRSAGGATRAWRIVRTTGTTGVPVEVVLDDDARASEADVFACHVDGILGAGWRSRPVVHVVLHPEARSTSGPSPWGGRLTKWNLGRAWSADAASLERALVHLDGVVLTAMPSVIELLAQRAPPGAGNPGLVSLSGEVVDATTIEALDGMFDAPVTRLYTLAEAGIAGIGCAATVGYHPATDAVVLEIVDDRGQPVSVGAPGEIVVTPLANRAMPLLRYRTGDMATWSQRPCGCGRTSPVFEIESARRGAHLVQTRRGDVVDTIRFAKLFATLDVRRIAVAASDDGGIEATYEADRPLDDATGSMIVGALRRVVSAATSVRVRRVAVVKDEPHVDQFAATQRPLADESLLASVAAWVKERVSPRDDVVSALITGSALDPSAVTRYSDIDVVVLVRGHVAPDWVELARALRADHQRVRVNVDRVERFAARAPLVACRLHLEQLTIVGHLDESVLPWPDRSSLAAEARYFSQSASAALWTRLTQPTAPADPVHEAWVASKLALDALRYRYLLEGSRETAARSILRRAVEDTNFVPMADVVEAFDVATEHRPPPVPGARRDLVHHRAALLLVDALSCSED